MDCGECELILPAYSQGELGDSEAGACRAHLDGCERCRAEKDAYMTVIYAIDEEPMLAVSASESARVKSALNRVERCRPAARQVSARVVCEFLAFAIASLAVFALIVMALSSRTLHIVNVPSPAGLPTWLGVIGGVALVVFVTSFVPIVITARRRPLNGLTFQK